MVRHRLRQSSNMIGPSGFVSLEDATVFLRIPQALDTDPQKRGSAPRYGKH